MKKKILLFSALLVLVFSLSGLQFLAQAQENNQVTIDESAGLISMAVEQLCQGQFDSAEELLSSVHTAKADKIKTVLKSFDDLSDLRQAAKEQEYQKNLKEFEEIKSSGVPTEPNDIVDAYAAILSVKEYANDEQKKSLFEDEFVKQVIDESVKKSIEHEEKGEWVEAYTSSYFWLSSLFEDNKNYKEKSESLTEKILIKSSLQDTLCETAKERHEGILPSMFSRTIKGLDYGYVSLIDYNEMAEKAINRCENLGEVLVYPDEKIEFSVDRAQVNEWNKALREIKKRIGKEVSGINRGQFLDIYEEIINLVPVTLKIPQEIVISQFAEASLATLDPHTNLIWPWQVRDFQKMMTQKFSGIGIEISRKAKELTVMSLLPGTPAYYSGLDAEDSIVEIDGLPTKDMSLTCAVSKITGPAGTDVTLTVRSKDQEETKKIKITRATIDVSTIRGWQRTEDGDWRFMLDEQSGVGYVRLTGFTDNTTELMKQAIQKMEGKKLNALVIDLRNNSGGYLQTAAEIVDLFVDEGTIVSTRPRWGMSEKLKAHKKATYEMPLAVLINGSSASASEIVSGALQDQMFERAVIIGERSYGKGSVQQIVSVPGNGAQLKYTMAFYHLPSGQRVKNRYEIEKLGRDDWGIAPDIEVELKANEIKKYYDVQKDNDVLVKADHDHVNGKIQRHDAKEVLESDPQLSAAVLVLRAKLIEVGIL